MALAEKLKKRGTTLKEILLATPYEALYSLDGLLSEEEFRKYLLVRGQDEASSFEESLEELYEALLSSSGFDNIILLHGYKGTGKTTLLREFVFRYSKGIEATYIDFHEARPLSIGGRAGRASSLIADLLKFQFLNKEEIIHQYQALSVMKRNLNSFPISDHLSTMLMSSGSNKTILQQLRSGVNLTFGDVFILYITLLFMKVSKTKLHFVIFDNLDAVDVEFVTPFFLDEFAKVLEATARLSLHRQIFKSNPLFTKRFRFIFAIREGNYSLLSVHFGDRLRGKIRTINVPFYLTPEIQRKIILRRLDFYQSLKENNQSEVEKVEFIVEQWVQEPLFENILASSFNGDYRKIVEAIFELVKKLKHVDKSFWRQRERSFNRRSYGVFGTLIRGAIDYWFPYFEPYYIDTPPNLKREGYFHPIRMVLNLVLNLSQGGISTYKSHYEHEGYSDLYTLVKALSKLYPCSVILRTVARLFLLHKNWVHLLSIYSDLPIEHEDSLIVHLLHSCSEEVRIEDNSALVECLENCKEVEEQFRKVKVKITPAGIAYLKHLHIHFEFYSALAKEQVPLFVAGETALQAKKGLSLKEAERIIKRVFKAVKNQREIMLRFYKRKFAGEMGFDVEKFLASNYAFLFSWRSRAYQGQFHITRVITAHIDYIENFRRFMINRVREEKARFSDLTPERQAMVFEINKKLLYFLKEYTYLLRQVPDPRVQRWVEILLHQIFEIESSDYTDMSTRVNLPKR